ncbi:T-cell surface glycoprotein CD1e, membrane-associated isoform X1 [Cebus imitator]|uniref:CD1e molecule n=1 Tax=Cebus imitator TaxID=2715852 RepID=A0A2K5PI97_CEBIM|nr:T-cell surface glycoprotein CD1e, membrane-associated isoform X1 [Cebus imitator]
MLLLLLLFEGLCCPGENTAVPQALQSYRLAAEEPLAFRMLQTSSFANHSWAHSEGSGWLGDLQTHGWDTALGTIRYLKPWSHGNFSQQELKNLQSLLQLYFHGFTRVVQAYAGHFQFEYPFEIQISAGCRMNAPQIFLNVAYQGLDFLSLQGISWEPSPGAGIRAQNVCKELNRYLDFKEILQSLLGHTCPRFLAGLMEGGESELKRKVKPEAWLSRGPSARPGRLLLVCHVSGFYPKPVWVMWMRGEQEQRGTQRGDVLPNADETWYLQATLEVATGEAAGLSCRVKHSSLEGHDLIIHWGGYSIFLILIYLTVIVTLVILVVLDSWFKKQSSNKNIPQTPSPVFPMGDNTQDTKNSRHQFCLAQVLWIRNRLLEKWKTRINQLW